MNFAFSIPQRAVKIATSGYVLSALPLLLLVIAFAPVLRSGLLIME
ncbi:hypothetical protein M2322_002916 [Rhodoblastus acidophilus]|nr:hypothetical protein [Rhodoblastus acidophilus]MCW2317357.1 hypothetical protein [Rhodoblastus acidophilus]